PASSQAPAAASLSAATLRQSLAEYLGLLPGNARHLILPTATYFKNEYTLNRVTRLPSASVNQDSVGAAVGAAVGLRAATLLMGQPRWWGGWKCRRPARGGVKD